MELEQIKQLVAKIKKFYDESKPGDTEVFLEENELEDINGICEKLYVTNIQDRGVFVHYGTSGDWTKALLITSENLDAEDPEEADFYDPADEAIEWFFE